jgi:sugar/nucleoside kinase (ribokinase family)
VSFGWRLRRERRRRGWSQDDLANGLSQAAAELGEPEPDVDRGTISRWERGVRRPQPRYVRLLCHRFGLSADQLGLLGDDGAERPSSTVGAFQEIAARLGASTALGLDVYVVTAHRLDLVHEVDRIAPDHETQVGPPLLAPGGSGANTAYALGRLGFRVATTGAVADDPAGALLREDLARAAVDVRDLVVLPAHDGAGTGTASVYVDPAGRPVVYAHPGANERFAAAADAAQPTSPLLERARSCRVLHLSSFTGPAERRLQERLLGGVGERCVASLAVGPAYAGLGLDRLAGVLGRVNVLQVGERRLDRMLEASCAAEPGRGSLAAKLERLFRWRARRGFTEPLVVVVERGGAAPGRAAVGCGRTSLEELLLTTGTGGLDARRVVDATGAGDAMAAGVLGGLLWGRDLGDCADLALVMGAQASSRLGARAGLPDRRLVGPRLP